MSNSSFTQSKWILYTGIGWFFGVLLVLLLAGLLESIHLDCQSLIGVAMGFGVGTIQWLLLKKQFAISFMWVIFLIIGLTTPFVIFDVASKYMYLPVESSMPVIVASGALLSSYLQYRFLLSSLNSTAKSWIGYSLAGWLVASSLCMFTGYTIHMHSITRNTIVVINILLFIAAGPILGIITGKGIQGLVKAEN